jgi:hypothetical protein
VPAAAFSLNAPPNARVEASDHGAGQDFLSLLASTCHSTLQAVLDDMRAHPDSTGFAICHDTNPGISSDQLVAALSPSPEAATKMRVFVSTPVRYLGILGQDSGKSLAAVPTIDFTVNAPANTRAEAPDHSAGQDFLSLLAGVCHSTPQAILDDMRAHPDSTGLAICHDTNPGISSDQLVAALSPSPEAATKMRVFVSTPVRYLRQFSNCASITQVTAPSRSTEFIRQIQLTGSSGIGLPCCPSVEQGVAT